MSMNGAVQASLKWIGNNLWLGDVLIAIVHEGSGRSWWTSRPDRNMSPSYEERADAKSDCESHVRTLLRKAVGA